MRIRRIILGPAGFKGLAIARGRGGVDRIKDKEGILQERINERTFGLFQTEGDLLSTETLLEPSGPVCNGFGGMLQDGIFSLSRGAIIETKGVLLARPIQTDEGGKVALARCYPIQLGLIHFKCWVVFCFSGGANTAGFHSAKALLF